MQRRSAHPHTATARRVARRLAIGSIVATLALSAVVATASAAPTSSDRCRSVERRLARASDGLLMPSESDFPFTAFTWPGAATPTLTPDRLLQLTGQAPGTAVEVVDLDVFFRNVALPQPWHDRRQAKDVVRFQRLVRTLDRNLTDIRVYRVGTIRIDAYVVGACGRDLAGLSTTLIET